MNGKVIAIAAAILALATLGYFVFAANNSTQPSNPTSENESTTQSSPTFSEGDEDEEESSMQKSGTVVTLTREGFSPSTITITAEDTVTWVNGSGAIATVDSVPHPVHTSYPLLNLGNFSSGSELKLQFTEAGTYKYHNHLNPSHTGTIIVQ